MAPKFDPNEVKIVYVRQVAGEPAPSSVLAPKVADARGLRLACGRDAELRKALKKAADRRRRRLSAELQNVREAPGKLGEAPGKLGEAPTLSNFLEKCCILEKSRKKIGEIWRKFSKFWQILEKNINTFSNF